MRNTMRTGFILTLLIPSLIVILSCAKQASSVKKEPAKKADQLQIEQQQESRKERPSEDAEGRAVQAAKIKFMYEDIYFEKGSYRLQPEAQAILKRKAEFLRQYPEISVVLEGHTDESGSKEFNFALGDRRAGEVKSFLLKEGIESFRLIPVSFGNERPIDTAKTENAQAKNRRVHFVIEE
jgi:peptidoglycan-associated lipoprotein